jgi:Type I restriction modification DNA specificity domain
MADPLLQCPTEWLRGTLEPDSQGLLIQRADTGSTPSTTREEYWDGDIPWLTPKEVTGLTDGLFVSRTERNITKAGLENSSTKLLPAGTVMLTKRAPVGAVVVNAVPMTSNQGFLNFQCGPALRPLYLAYWFRANKAYLDLVANGSTYPELYRGDLFEFEIAVPSVEVQDKIIEVLSSLQLVTLMGLPLEQSVTSPEQMLAVQNQTRRLANIRDHMLPLLLSGQLDVSHASPSLQSTHEQSTHARATSAVV